MSRIRFILIRIRIRGNFNSVILVFPIKCFAMFFHINYIYNIIRNVTKKLLPEIFFLRVNSIFRTFFPSSPTRRWVFSWSMTLSSCYRPLACILAWPVTCLTLIFCRFSTNKYVMVILYLIIFIWSVQCWLRRPILEWKNQ